ncbi:MAG: hypothetical protein H0X03_00400 [Nitrosopumilus sp.]|nr:hypothetical protein [Nitrosopumilus sp.]
MRTKLGKQIIELNLKNTSIGVLIIIMIGMYSLTFISSDGAYGQSPTIDNPQTQVSDFVIVPIHQHLGDNKSDIFAPSYPYRGDVSDTFTFTIDTIPLGKSYLLAQVYGSYFQGHTIIINEQNVTNSNNNFGGTGYGNWGTLTVLLDDKILKQGPNTYKIQRNTNTPDNFLIDNIIVNWQHQLTQ